MTTEESKFSVSNDGKLVINDNDEDADFEEDLTFED